MKYSDHLLPTLRAIFQKKFNQNPQFVFSPGRINLIGEHTDYNDGYVMPAAIDKGIYIAFERNEKKTIRLFSYDFDESIENDLNTIKPISKSWANYILGVVSEITKLKSITEGFDMIIGGDIPIGSGLSSSAALECGVGFALNHLFALSLKKIQLIKAGQQAEHTYVGVRCGIMDQFASMMGKAHHVILLDCRSLDYKYLPSIFKEYQFILFNSKVKHSLAESEYNIRREDCETGVKILKEQYPEITALRDVTIEMLSNTKNHLSQTVYKRCAYVIEENQRVLDASSLLEQQNLENFGQLLYKSHQGLSENFEVSCPELDFLVATVKKHDSVLGARMMGGGFGGCTINLMRRDQKEAVIRTVQEEYSKQFNISLECYEIELEMGTHLIKTKEYEPI